MISIDRVRAAVREHLSAMGFDDKSIRRIVEDDLPYLTEWVLEPSAPADLQQAKAIIAFAFGFGDWVSYEVGNRFSNRYHGNM